MTIRKTAATRMKPQTRKTRNEFEEYFKQIGLTRTLAERIREIYSVYEALCPEPILSAFVSDYVQEDGTRRYEKITFFSAQYAMETSGIAGVIEDDFEIAPIRNRIRHCSITRRDYDFTLATGESRLNIDCHIDGGAYYKMRASSANCDYLKQIYLAHVQPNLQPDPD